MTIDVFELLSNFSFVLDSLILIHYRTKVWKFGSLELVRNFK